MRHHTCPEVMSGSKKSSVRIVPPRHRSSKAMPTPATASQKTLFDLPAEIRSRIFAAAVSLDRVDIR
jgi:hypothetical protein